VSSSERLFGTKAFKRVTEVNKGEDREERCLTGGMTKRQVGN
jgi:hypothetical protein